MIVTDINRVEVGGVDEKTFEQLQAEQNLDSAIPDNEAPLGGEGQQNAPSENAETALYGLLSLLPIGLALSGLKNTAQVWSDDVCMGVSRAFVPVLRKYTFGQKFIAFLETGGGVEEIALGVVLAPVAIATYQAYLIDTKPVEKEVKDAETEGGNNHEPMVFTSARGVE